MNQIKNLEQTETVLRAGISGANNNESHKYLLRVANKLSYLGFDDDSSIIKRCLRGDNYYLILTYLSQTLGGVKHTLALLTNGKHQVFII